MMKRLVTLTLAFFLLGLISCYKKSANKAESQPVDLSHWVAPYFLDTPDGWSVEHFPIPIEFAPDIPYSGVEDIRFSPGWGNTFSDEHWTYCFLWYLDGKPEITSETLEENLRSYYTGLVGRNMESRQIAATKYFKPVTSFKKITAADSDLETYQGTIHMLDYHKQEPITLNCKVHFKACNVADKSFLFFEISPKPETDSVWIPLEKIWTDFRCSK